MTEKTNALGQPAPNRTDFRQWQRDTLEQFARQAADENLVLRAEVDELKASNKQVLDAWRRAVTTNVVAGSAGL